MDVETADLVRWASGHVSRQPTRAATTTPSTPVQHDVEPEVEAIDESQTQEDDDGELVVPRASTQLDRQFTRVTTAQMPILLQQDVVSEPETVVGRQTPVNDEPTPAVRRTTTRVSRQPTQIATIQMPVLVQRDVEPEPEAEPETDAETEFAQPLFDQPPAAQLASTSVTRQPTRIATVQMPVLVQRDVEPEPEPESMHETGPERDSPQPPLDDVPGAWPHSTRVSRQPTRVATIQMPPLVQRDVAPDFEPEPTQPTIAEPDTPQLPLEDFPGAWPVSIHVSRQATRVATMPMVVPIQRDVEPEPIQETGTEPDSERSSVLNEPLAAYDVYRGAPATAPEVSSEEVPRAVERATTRRESVPRVQEEPASTYPYSPQPAVPSRQPAMSAPQRQPTAPREAGKPTSDPRMDGDTTQRTADLVPEEEPGRVDRAPTAGLIRFLWHPL
jgi:hypothetical protein